MKSMYNEINKNNSLGSCSVDITDRSDLSNP
jgi:hypothetical protein